jgi:ATP-binding cassette subfamily B protein
MSAMVSFERLFEVLDLEPMIKESPTRDRYPTGRRSWSSTTSTSPIPAPRTCRWRHSKPWPAGRHAPHRRSLRRRLRRRARDDDRAGRAERRRQDDDLDAGLAALRRRRGSVTINGVDLRDASTASLNATVGVVTQDPHLFHDTLRANLIFAKPDATEAEIEAALRGRRSGTWWRRCPSVSRPWWASAATDSRGGEKQRVALARLLLKAPRLVVLDEATAHLDNESEAAVQRALDETMSRAHVTGHRAPTLDDSQRRSDLGR